MTALNFPTSPADGDTFDNYIYDGTKAVWRIQPNIPDISSKFQVSATAPTDPVNGEVWLNSTDGNTYIYYVDADSSQWIEIGGNTAPPPILSDLNDVEIYEALDGQALVYDSISDKWVNESGLATETYVQENFGPKFLLETTEKTADYTLEIGDVNKVIDMNKSGAATLTIPTNASVAFPIGTIIGVYNQSADDVTIAGAAGVTLRNDGDLAQYAEVSLRKRATDEWVLAGVVS